MTPLSKWELSSGLLGNAGFFLDALPGGKEFLGGPDTVEVF